MEEDKQKHDGDEPDDLQLKNDDAVDAPDVLPLINEAVDATEDLQQLKIDDGDVLGDSQLKDDVVDAPEGSKLKNDANYAMEELKNDDAVDVPEDFPLINEAADATEDLQQLKTDAVDVLGDSQLKDDAVDAPEDLMLIDDANYEAEELLKIDVVDVPKDAMKNNVVDASTDISFKNVVVCGLESLQLTTDVSAAKDSQLTRDAVCAAEEMQLKDYVDVPTDLQPLPTEESDHKLACDEEAKWPGWPGESVFRMLIPDQKVAALIGLKGVHIKQMMKETEAHIRVLNAPPGSLDKIVIIHAPEVPGSALSPAINGLLKVHGRIIGFVDDATHAPRGAGGTVMTRILVPDAQCSDLMGKQDSTMKPIIDASGCMIDVLRAEHMPVTALKDDMVVRIQGEPAGVHKAVELIANHLRKFLVDRSVIPLFQTQMQIPKIQPNKSMSLIQLRDHPYGVPESSAVGADYGSNPQSFVAERPYSDYDLHSTLPSDNQPRPIRRRLPFDKQSHPTLPFKKRPHPTHPFGNQPHQHPPMFARDTSVDHHSPPTEKVTHRMRIPGLHADTLIGISGGNLSFIRHASEAAIVIVNRTGIPDEMTIEISGSSSQVQAAQRLIQNFIPRA